MQKEGRERERQRRSKMKLRHSVCFPEEKEVPDLLPDQQCRASWWSKEAGIEISDPDQCL